MRNFTNSFAFAFKQLSLKESFGMKTNLRIVFFLLVSVFCLKSAIAQCPSDNAGGYTGWSNGNNGGSGFGAWQLTTSGGGSSGFFRFTSTNNDAGSSTTNIDVSSNSWGLFSHSDGAAVANAVRPFTNALGIGQSLKFSIDNGSITNGSTVGFSLRNASGEILMELYFVGGQANYTLRDATSTTSIGLGFSRGGFDVTLTRTGTATYNIEVVRKDNSSTSTFTNRTFLTTSSSTPQQARFFNANSGNGADFNFYVNSLSITAPPTPTINVTNATCSSAGSATVSNYNAAYTYTFTPSGPTVGSGGVISGFAFGQSYTVTASNGTCTSSASSSFTIQNTLPAPTAGITNNSGTTILTCTQTSISVTATGGTSYSWDGGLGTGASKSISSPGTYTVTVTGANGCTATASITITQNITAPTAGITNNSGTTILTCTQTSISVTATGGTSYSWDGGLGTGASKSITSPGTYTVTVTGANGCTATASITVTQDLTNTFTGTGDWTDASKWSCGVPATGDVIVIASGANVTLNTDFTVAGSLTMNATSTLTVNPARTLTITGTANFNNQSVILKSDNTGTATLGQVTGTLSNATNVTVERYLGTIAKRAWRLVTAPVTGSSNNSVFFNWQNNGSVAGSTGIEIWGPGGTGSGGNGLAVGPANSMRGFVNGAFVDVTNTTTTKLFDDASSNQLGYFLFVAGPYGSGNINQTSPTSPFAPATVKATGSLRVGNYSYQTSGQTGNANRSYFIGNPYASPVNPNSITGTNLQNTFYMWDPALQGLYNVGGYVAYDRSNNTYNVGANPGTSYSNSPVTAIQSGQAFIARADAAGDITVNFTESMKGGSSTNNTSRTTTVSEQLRVILQRNFAGSDYLTSDGVVAFYYDNASAAINGMDGRKLLNSFDNLMMVRNSTNLTFEHRPLVTAADTIFLALSNTSQANYRFEISTENFRPAFGYKPYLQDLYLNTETMLPLNGSAGVNFAIDANAASTGNRFRIIFRADVATSIRDNDAGKWIKIYPNPAVAGNALQIEFKNRTAGKYNFVLYNAAGMQVFNAQLLHAGGTALSKVELPATLSKGIYIAEVSDEKGSKQELKITIQ